MTVTHLGLFFYGYCCPFIVWQIKIQKSNLKKLANDNKKAKGDGNHHDVTWWLFLVHVTRPTNILLVKKRLEKKNMPYF